VRQHRASDGRHGAAAQGLRAAAALTLLIPAASSLAAAAC
jgi:hypothetical protein